MTSSEDQQRVVALVAESLLAQLAEVGPGFREISTHGPAWAMFRIAGEARRHGCARNGWAPDIKIGYDDFTGLIHLSRWTDEAEPLLVAALRVLAGLPS